MRPRRSQRLYQNVAELLTRSIAAGTYRPGDRLPAERDLAQQLDVSRPTLREAIIALELDGLVEVKTGSGVYVLPPSARRSEPVERDIGALELTEARMLIESEVAAMAALQISDEEVVTLRELVDRMASADAISAERIDQQFHETIAEASRNNALSLVVDQLWQTRNRSPQCVRFFDRSREKGNRPVVAEHAAIANALAARDAGAAREKMRDHLARVLGTLLDATEVDAIENARAKLAAHRSRLSAFSR